MTYQEKSKWVKDNLNTESAEVLMMFVDYMYENGFTDFGECFGYLDYFKADEESVGLIHSYGKDEFCIYLNHKYFEHEKFPYDDELAEFMRRQVKPNWVCSSNCKHCKEPEEFIFLGKKIDNVCKNCRLAFISYPEKLRTNKELGFFDAEKMKMALKAMDVSKKIIEHIHGTV